MSRRVILLTLWILSPVSDAEEANPGVGAVEAMHSESLMETAPSSLGVASNMLTTAYKGGVEDIGAYTYLLKLLIQHALHLAEKNPSQSEEFKAEALAMTYNLASNTWIGWGRGEVGAVEDSHRKIGLEAARLNVRIGEEIGLPPGRRANGYWVLGAHLIAAARHSEAADAFATSRGLAAEAGLDLAKTMAQGWIHFSNILAGSDESLELADIQNELRSTGEDDGEFFAGQFDTAMDVFKK